MDNNEILESIRWLEKGLKTKAGRISREKNPTERDSITLESVVLTLQYMHSLKLIKSWRWEDE